MLSDVFFTSVRADGIPSLVEIVGSDNGGEFFGGRDSHLCAMSF